VSGGQLYFGFGSNLHVAQMRARCPDCEVVGPAILSEYRLTFFGTSKSWDGGGVATVSPSAGRRVPGALYRLSEDDFERLDGFEDQYGRARVRVRIGREVREALTYLARPPAFESAPSSRYVATIAHGYGHFGHPLVDLLEAVGAIRPGEPVGLPG